LLAELARLPRLRPLLFALSPLPLASLAAGPLFFRPLAPPRGPGDMLVALSWKPLKPLLPEVPYLEGCGPNLRSAHSPLWCPAAVSACQQTGNATQAHGWRTLTALGALRSCVPQQP
jgi:hypothetical protein